MLQRYGSGKMICKFFSIITGNFLEKRTDIKDKGGKKIFAKINLPPYLLLSVALVVNGGIIAWAQVVLVYITCLACAESV